MTGCFGEDDAAAVLVDERDGYRAVVEGVKLFSNAALAEDGNAALGLALLGQTDRVVWYVPSFEDTDIEGTTPTRSGASPRTGSPRRSCCSSPRAWPSPSPAADVSARSWRRPFR